MFSNAISNANFSDSDDERYEAQLARRRAETEYHKWSLTICDGCFDTLKSSKMRS